MPTGRLQARENIGQALRGCQAKLGNEIVMYDEKFERGDGPLAAQYAILFGAIAHSVIEYQFFKGNRLPTKVRRNAFEWGMGPGLAAMPSLKGADYGLFINTNDAYGSTGRKVLQVVAMFGGIAVTSGEHIGYAGLVDLKTGDLVWLNADRQMGGDVRSPEGAAKRVRQLLEGFPGGRWALLPKQCVEMLRSLPLIIAAVSGAALSVNAQAAPEALPAYTQAYEPRSVDERGMWMDADEIERKLRNFATRHSRSGS